MASNPIGLIVGRGNRLNEWWKQDGSMHELPFLFQDSVLLIPCDAFGGSFQEYDDDGRNHHLWLDFNSKDVAAIGAETLEMIIIDWSTWRYLKPLNLETLAYWHRMIKPHPDKGMYGCLVFEASISSMLFFSSGKHFPQSQDYFDLFGHQDDNYSHVSIPIEYVQALIAETTESFMDMATRYITEQKKHIQPALLKRRFPISASNHLWEGIEKCLEYRPLNIPALLSHLQLGQRNIISADSMSHYKQMNAVEYYCFIQAHSIVCEKWQRLFLSQGWQHVAVLGELPKLPSSTPSNLFPIPTRKPIPLFIKVQK